LFSPQSWRSTLPRRAHHIFSLWFVGFMELQGALCASHWACIYTFISPGYGANARACSRVRFDRDHDNRLNLQRKGTEKSMRHTRSRSRTSTKYIELDRRRCRACWKCVETCPNGVLGKIIFFNHRHARVANEQACKGCKKCVDSCPNGAIRFTYVPSTHRPRADGTVLAEGPVRVE